MAVVFCIAVACNVIYVFKIIMHRNLQVIWEFSRKKNHVKKLDQIQNNITSAAETMQQSTSQAKHLCPLISQRC